MRQLFLLLLSFSSAIAYSQTILSGIVKDAATSAPLEGASVTIMPASQTIITNDRGYFSFRISSAQASITISAIGHQTTIISIEDFLKTNNTLLLPTSNVELSEVTVTGKAGEQYRSISKVDIKLRGSNNSQEVLRMVPGLFIGQHAGGGKAEQIFLRGFDIDHGTDINISVDDMPVNMVSHAHGQGYADLHFLIPELIDNVSFKKGPYYADKGNFTTTGFVDFKTANALSNSSVKLEAGMFNTFRAVGLFNLLSDNAKAKGQSAYIASEAMYTDGYFDHPQNFNRINLFGKYNGALNKHHTLTVSASTFSSKWDASGQIPERAVASGAIGFYGAIDPDEGGTTSRTNVNAILTSVLNNGAYFKNQLYYSHYKFELYSNFTFYKEDSVNGDQIRQKENRHLAGYNGSFHKTGYIGNTQLISEAGMNVRLDRTGGSELSRTKDRTTTITQLMLGDISDNNVAAYISETFSFSPKFNINAGLHYDYFSNQYKDDLNNGAIGTAHASIVSPKLSINYQASKNVQLYVSNGRGFHSNDTRVVVPQNGLQILPAAYGSDLGTIWKPAKNLFVNATLWYLYLQQEFMYVGDEGVVEPSGKTRRYGADVSVRYQPLSWLYADMDVNYSHARAIEEAKGKDYIPLAPKLTSIGGLTAKLKSDINASLRYRYMGDRPAVEDNSTVAKGYFVTDAYVSYQQKKYELGLSVQNLFNVKWKQTQFYTESQLQNESTPVSEIHFTPGTPFFGKIIFTLFF